MAPLLRGPLRADKNAWWRLHLIHTAAIWEFHVPGFLVLVRADSPGLYILSPSAAHAWRLLRSGKALNEAIFEFAASYDILEDIAARDLQFARSEWEQSLLAPIPRLVTASKPPALPAYPAANSFCRDYRLHGKTIRVILHDPDLIAEITPRLETLLTSPASHPDVTLQALDSENGYHIFSGAACVATEDHPASARVVFLQELVRSTLANPDWCAILHAGACGTEHQCVLFPAASQSGKTTLAAALMHAGLTFYGDDSIALQAGSLTIPVMPFSLMIREDSWPQVSARFPEFQDAPVHDRYGQKVRFLHPTCPSHNLQARAVAIVFSKWQADASTDVSPIESFEALVRLRDSGLWVAHDRDNIQIFLNWIESLPLYEMIYSDVDEAVAFIKRLVGL